MVRGRRHRADERRFVERAAGRHLTLRDAVELALDAIDEGDVYDAERILADAVGRPYRALRNRMHRCGICGVGFDWGGQLADHVALTHPEEEAAA